MTATTNGPTLVWLRDDLRLADNPALHAAVDQDRDVIVFYLLDEESDGIRPFGGAARWWLHGSLTALAQDLEKRGATLVLRRGAAAREVPKLVKDTGAAAVYWNRRYSAARDVDAGLKTTLKDEGLDVQSFQGSLLHEPWTAQTGEGNPFRVFTPFWRACQSKPEPREPLPKPRSIRGGTTPKSDDLDEWQLLPTRPDWAGGLRDRWVPGEASAKKLLEYFADDVLQDYHKRDEPLPKNTSDLSPHLRWGEISPFQVWHRMQGDLAPAARKNAGKFLTELGWREFNWNILYHAPDLHEKNFRPEFDAFPWEEPDAADLAAWQKGRTGIPLVDAGMRELWETGYMHNRVRMVTASFLIKNLLIDWRIGEKWFWDTLVDADEASNPGNWQWVAGSGADAAPYFRIFNPQLQADKFDKGRKYQLHWIPELDDPEYPDPIVDLKQTRQEALDAYDVVKRANPRG